MQIAVRHVQLDRVEADAQRALRAVDIRVAHMRDVFLGHLRAAPASSAPNGIADGPIVSHGS